MISRLVKIFIGWCLIGCIYSVAPLWSQDARPATPTRWALIVAVDQYANSRYQTDFAVDGGKALAALLTGHFGYQPEAVIELYGETASAENVFNTLERLIRQIRPGDSFFAYFGTATAVNNYGETFLAPYEGVPERSMNMVPLAKMLYWLQSHRAASTLVVFEDCVGEDFPRLLKKTFRGVGALNSIYNRSCMGKGYDPNNRRYFSEAFREVLQQSAERSVDVSFERLNRSLQSRLKFYLETIRTEPEFIFTIQRPAGEENWMQWLSKERNSRDRIYAIGELLKSLQVRQEENPVLRKALGEALIKIATDESDEVSVRVKAIEALGQMNYTDALVALAQLLGQSGENNVRIHLAVIYATEQMKSPETVAFFRQALTHRSATVRKEAIRILALYGDQEAGPDIMAMLARESDEEVLIAALESLPQFGTRSITEVGTIAGLLQHPNPRVRSSAMGTLADLRAGAAAGAVIAALQRDPETDVRGRAAYALSKLVQPETREEIVSALREALKNDAAPPVKVGAIFSLGEIGATDAEKDLRRALSRSEDTDVRKAAIEALGKLRSERAVEDLIALLRDPAWTIRRESAQALGEIGDTRAVEPLLAASKDSDYYVRQAASAALDKIWGQAKQAPIPVEDEFAALRKSLADPSPVVRTKAVQQLAAYGQADVVPDLLEMLDDPDYKVREAVINALKNFRDENTMSLVIHALQDRNFLKRQGAVKILGSQGELTYLEYLLPLAGDPNSAVRAELAQILGNFTTDEVLSPLINALNDADAAVRTGAAQALARQVFRLKYQGREDRANEILEKAFPIIEANFNEDHPWRRWYNVLTLRSPARPWQVDFTLRGNSGAATIFDAPQTVTVNVNNAAGENLYYVLLNLSTNGKIHLVNDPATLLQARAKLGAAVEVYLPAGASYAYDAFKVIACSEPVEPYELANALDPDRQFGKGRFIITSPLVGMIAGYRKFAERVDPHTWETIEKVVVLNERKATD